MTAADAMSYAALYRDPGVNHGEQPFLAGESAEAFLERITACCERLYGIVEAGLPDRIIGDCALHHWQPGSGDIEIGGALLPGFQGRGIMSRAFRELIRQAAGIGARRVIGRTAPGNTAAIRLVERLGFRKAGIEAAEQVLILDL